MGSRCRYKQPIKINSATTFDCITINLISTTAYYSLGKDLTVARSVEGLSYSCCELSSISVLKSHTRANVLTMLKKEGGQTRGREEGWSNWASTASPLPSWRRKRETLSAPYRTHHTTHTLHIIHTQHTHTTHTLHTIRNTRTSCTHTHTHTTHTHTTHTHTHTHTHT